MLVTVCIGSSCHLKGSREIVQKLEYLINSRNLEERVLLKGEFCMGECLKGVCVKVDGEIYSLSPQDTDHFFEEKILGRLNE